MTQKSDTRAVEARASRNSCGGCFRDPLSPPASSPQAVPELIALHLGESFFSELATGGDRD